MTSYGVGLELIRESLRTQAEQPRPQAAQEPDVTKSTRRGTGGEPRRPLSGVRMSAFASPGAGGASIPVVRQDVGTDESLSVPESASQKIQFAGEPPSALSAITNLIPAEGLAVYVGAYGVLVGAAPEQWKVLAAFATLAMAMAVGAYALLYPVWQQSRLLPTSASKTLLGQALLRAAGMSLLLLIYVVSTPGNPFALWLGLPTEVGLGLIIAMTAIIGIRGRQTSPGKTRDSQNQEQAK